jgi:hypothetical protein
MLSSHFSWACTGVYESLKSLNQFKNSSLFSMKENCFRELKIPGNERTSSPANHVAEQPRKPQRLVAELLHHLVPEHARSLVTRPGYSVRDLK